MGIAPPLLHSGTALGLGLGLQLWGYLYGTVRVRVRVKVRIRVSSSSNSVLKLKDKKGVLLVDKTEVATRKKAMKLKVDEFIAKGFNNIVLSGHSAGAWTSLVLKSN